MVIVWTAMFERTCAKYGDRGYRLILLEAGHAGQNAVLLAAGLKCGALVLGGFYDSALGAALDLDPEKEAPIYCVALGKVEKSSLKAR
ncbi:hypothetical protein BH11VER1_BH11VER1_14190 [soil metagenome]